MPRHSIFYALLCSMLLASASRGEKKAFESPVATLTSMDVLDNQRKLKPWDLVSIRIVEDKRDALQQVVTVTGEVQAPYLGIFKATGLTSRELAYKLKAELEKSFFKEATVSVTYDGKHVDAPCYDLEFVVAFGAIAKQGKFDLVSNPDLTVTGLFKLAGGITAKSPAPKIRIFRKTAQGNKCILVNSKAVLVQKRSEYDLFLRPDDVVIVE